MSQTQSGGGSVSSSSSDVYTEVYDYLVQNGLTPIAAAGVMGNLQQESGMDPGMEGGGLAQWGGQRLTNLDSYAQQNGLSEDSLNAQLGYLMQEIETGSGFDGGNESGLNAQTTPQMAALYFSNTFERPAASAANNTGREQYALDVYQHFVNGQPLNLQASTGNFDGPAVPGTTTDSTSSTPTGLSGNFLTDPGQLIGAILGILAGLALVALGIWISLNPFSDLTTAISGALKNFAKMPTEGLTQRVQQAPSNYRKQRAAKAQSKLLDAAGKESAKVTNIEPRTKRENIRLKDTPIDF